MQELKISVAIVSHNRLESLKNMIHTIKNQTYPIHELKIFCSGYDEEVIKSLGVDYSMEPDRKDWGHDKRAKALKWFTGDYILTASDDDQYLFTFLERMIKSIGEARPDIIFCDFATKTRPEYYLEASLNRGCITNGCLLTSKEIAATVEYTDRNYGGDWNFVSDCISAGALFHHVPETLFFHY